MWSSGQDGRFTRGRSRVQSPPLVLFPTPDSLPWGALSPLSSNCSNIGPPSLQKRIAPPPPPRLRPWLPSTSLGKSLKTSGLASVDSSNRLLPRTAARTEPSLRAATDAVGAIPVGDHQLVCAGISCQVAFGADADADADVLFQEFEPELTHPTPGNSRGKGQGGLPSNRARRVGGALQAARAYGRSCWVSMHSCHMLSPCLVKATSQRNETDSA